MTAVCAFFAVALAFSFSIAPFGCRRAAGPAIGQAVVLAADKPPVGPWTEDARPFAGHLASLAVKDESIAREKTLVADASAKGLDAASVQRAFKATAVATKGTAVLTASARPATLGGRKAWVVIQAWGRLGGLLDHVRVWVVDAADGRILSAGGGRL